jgi:hypothetical protein
MHPKSAVFELKLATDHGADHEFEIASEAAAVHSKVRRRQEFESLALIV